MPTLQYDMTLHFATDRKKIWVLSRAFVQARIAGQINPAGLIVLGTWLKANAGLPATAVLIGAYVAPCQDAMCLEYSDPSFPVTEGAYPPCDLTFKNWPLPPTPTPSHV